MIVCYTKYVECFNVAILQFRSVVFFDTANVCEASALVYAHTKLRLGDMQTIFDK